MNVPEKPSANTADTYHSPWDSVSFDTLVPESQPAHKRPSQDPTLAMWQNIDSPTIRSFNKAIDIVEDPSAIAEILQSDTAKHTLPYLSLEHLSDSEKASVLSLSKAAFEQVKPILMHHRYSYDILPQYLATAGNEGEAEKRGKISPKLGEVRKLFCASLADTFNNSDPNRRELIRQAFFSSSPDFASYVGGLKGSLELLPIASRSDSSTIARNIYDEIRYDYSGADFNGYNNVLMEESNPIKQLQLIPIMYNVTLGCDSEGWSSNSINYISEALYHLSDSPSTTPLVRLVADSFDRKISNDLNTEWVFVDPDDPEYAELFKRDAERRANIQAKQDALHQKYPTLPTNQRIIEIAPNIAATVDGYSQLNLISDSTGEQASLLDYEADNPFNLDHDSALLISSAHNPEVKPLIDSQLSLDLSSISLSAQIQLLKYMTEADSTRYDNLCKTLKNTAPSLRNKLAEAFLSADFGPDFGDSLLTIANSDRISKDKLESILDSFDSCRTSIKTITSLYSPIDDGAFSEQYSRAANERLTDALTVFREIAEHGSAEADLDWVQGRNSFDLDQAMEALSYEQKSLTIIGGVMDDLVNTAIEHLQSPNSPQPPHQDHPSRLNQPNLPYATRVLSPDNSPEYSLFNFYSPSYGHILLYARPEGSSIRQSSLIEYGSRTGVEASISLIVDPINSFALPNPFHEGHSGRYDPSFMNKISAIRLDREGRTPGTLPNDPNRSAVNPDGTISVDLAAILDRDDTPSGKVARLIAVGNKLRQQSHNTDFNLNHNTHWFDQSKYGTADGFAKIANYIIKYSNYLCSQLPAPEGAGYEPLKNDAEQKQKRRRRHSPRRRSSRARIRTISPTK